MITAFLKFAFISAKICQYNGNKICLNEFTETNELFFFFNSHLHNNFRSNFIFYFIAKWLPFIYCSRETFTKICTYIYIYIYIFNQNTDRWPLITNTLKPNPFKFHSAADHFMHLLPTTNLRNVLPIFKCLIDDNII